MDVIIRGGRLGEGDVGGGVDQSSWGTGTAKKKVETASVAKVMGV